MSIQSIVSLKNYGDISLTLKDVMDSKCVNRNNLAKLIDVRFEVVNKWYNGNVEKMDLDVLAKICFALDCNVNDILFYNKPTLQE